MTKIRWNLPIQLIRGGAGIVVKLEWKKVTRADIAEAQLLQRQVNTYPFKLLQPAWTAVERQFLNFCPWLALLAFTPCFLTVRRRCSCFSRLASGGDDH
jgi:hypothetical protein